MRYLSFYLELVLAVFCVACAVNLLGWQLPPTPLFIMIAGTAWFIADEIIGFIT